MVYWEGHEVAMVSTISGALWLTHRSLPKHWVRGFVHRQPVAALATTWAIIGISAPVLIPRLRRAMKLPTNHYDAEHPKAVVPKSKIY